ncbi:ATP-dependent RecD-like DNA helicase [Peptoniphilus sp. MSJ-1]|uniref:ATP-dependent RecD2 DNA helicase n=1 Tax=Peptoniphilus ovalis TaxID=2841503 RepID=A0ABS6FDS2_9FIRM|nr:ATP-dependent RecD-like DNA helicase [Peptoniphilus ovalis]MBU5668333.1 ATP-dependent RecD-like DNA helicase [Peptoniphilus ovalis]
MISLEGIVEKIIFRNEENGYTVALISTEDGEVIVVGSATIFRTSASYKFSGDFTYHAKYGEQFAFDEIKELVPETERGIINYLSSAMIPHIGEKMAKRIVDKFKDETLDVIENSPERLLSITGIGRKKFKDIKEALDKQYAMRKIFLYFSNYNISSAIILKIYKEFGEESVNIVEKNPYDLIGRVRGLGFKKADEIAKNLGFDKNSDERKIAALKYALMLATSDGHSYLPMDKLIKATEKLLDIEFNDIDELARTLTLQKNFFVEKDGEDYNCYIARYLQAENYVAGKLNDLNISFDEDIDIDAKISEIEEFRKIKLSKSQRDSVKKSINRGVFVITGGPGTGKTTTLKAIIDIFESMDKKIKLAAPTGRAAKRMKEQTSRDAFTIHKLLEIGFGGEGFKEVEKLECDVLIVDEVSMVDILLMETLLTSIDPPTRLILVGDKDQLPSVGAGNVLSDILKSGVIEFANLEEIFRQSEESMIVKNAHLINHGKMPILNRGDFFMISERGENKGLETLKDLVKSRLTNYFNVEESDIQVLTPTKKGVHGTLNLNKELQDHLNKSEEFVEIAGRKFKLGDRVIQTKNNYELESKLSSDCYEESEKGVFNGDMGYISKIDKENKKLTVLFDSVREVEYEASNVEELSLAYAMTIHKSQGSEFPIVIIPLYWAPPILLTRNLIYTAITRASKAVVLIGRSEYLVQMINNNKTKHRYSNLCKKLEVASAVKK